MKSRPPGGGDLWVFGYGSLMWNPGFAHAEARPARLYGYHRAFCLYSEHYRGTEARPGLVLGLDRGGSCRGRAFRVPAHDADAAMEYLIAREMYGHEIDVYQLQWHRVALEGGMGGTGNTGGASGTGSTGNPGGTGGAACGSKGHRAGGGRRVTAACFIVNRAHPHYAGKLAPEHAAALIRAGAGESGSNVDYLLNTIRHLDELGINDGPIHDLAKRVGG